ncbi:Uncharacterised protein [Klebsiella pneumoniae]|nr:Uncharacterised protein [Klebsiella pneumoniae]SYR18280.1 Uncharacterised protein [Klebsiella pneumoniae]
MAIMATLSASPVYGEGKPCRLSPIYPPFLTSSQKLARRAFSPSWILKSRTYRWWALTAPLCPRRSPWRRAPLSSRCAQPPMKPSRKRKKISRATSARLSKAATASAKPINVPTSISLTWWLGKPPATAKRKCMSTWPSSRRSTSCSCRTAPAMPPRAHCGKRRSCACSR